VQLVQQAQLGDEECLNRLAEAVRVHLQSYVYRYTLADDLTDDIVQDSILKMFERLGELREADKFWPWLHKIALNKIRLDHRSKQRHKTVSAPHEIPDHYNKESQEAIVGMVYREMRDAVFAAMRELKPAHRTIINMRCYDQMPYSEIAKVMECSEFAAQKRFYRAKKTLKKKLARHGLGRGSLLMSLVLFGKLTAPSKAAATSISITSATVKVGTAASAAAIVAGKTAILSIITAGALTVGTIVATSGPEGGGDPVKDTAESSYSYAAPQQTHAYNHSRECWYYYPSKATDAVMMRIKIGDSEGEPKYCRYLQNGWASYYYHKDENTVHIENHRPWQKDMSVWRLPTDSPELINFLTRMDGKEGWSGGVGTSRSNLLVVMEQPGKPSGDRFQVTHHSNVLGEDYFKFDWPSSAKLVDNRDAVHKRGWTYFTVTGRINDEKVEGKGRIPFVYAEIRRHRPWIRLDINGEIYVDKAFIGLARPWTGLHTIDVIRRDAAKKQIPFETKVRSDERKAQVIMTTKSGKVIYTIDMPRDLVEQIVFTGDRQGRLTFDYLQEVENKHDKFAEPRRTYRTNKEFSLLECN